MDSSTIEEYIQSYITQQTENRVSPLETKVEKYSELSAIWSELKTSLTSLNSSLRALKITTSSSVFNARTATTSDDDFVTATASKNAIESSYSLRVNQLAKSDLVLSQTMESTAAETTMAGTHTIKIASGDYWDTVDVELTGDETTESIMEKITEAINSDEAVIDSSSVNATDTFTGAGEFVIRIGQDVEGEEDDSYTDYSFDYDYSGVSYNDALADIAAQINGEDIGVVAKVVTDGSTVSLQITVEDDDNYITMTQASDTGSLLSSIGIDVENQQAASGLVDASYFTPSTGYSKMSFTSDETGYDSLITMSDESGSILEYLGLTSDLLTDRTLVTSDTDAGYMYSATSSTDNELNAQFTFNGINIQRSSNTVDDLVDNVTFKLKSVMDSDDSDVTVKVDIDTESIIADIEEFITAFNEVYTYIKSYSTSDSDGRGALVGNSSARSLLSQLTNSVVGSVDGLDDDVLQYLSQIGITFDTEVGLSITDSDDLEDAIENNTSEVADLFSSESGIATTLYDYIKGYLGADGTISHLVDSYDSNITYLNDKIDTISDNIDTAAEVLRQKYQTMNEQLLILMNSQNSYSSLSSS